MFLTSKERVVDFFHFSRYYISVIQFLSREVQNLPKYMKFYDLIPVNPSIHDLIP